MQKLKLALVFVFLFAVVVAAKARELVQFDDAPAGVIVIVTSERALYLTLGNGRALRYPVAVGKRGKQWFGTRYIDGKHINPAWSPPS